MGKNIRNKTRRGDTNLGSAFAKGIIAALIAETLLLAAAAALTYSAAVPQGLMPAAAAACAALSAFAGAAFCGKSAPKLSLPLALGVGAAELAVNFLLGLLIGEKGGLNVIMPTAFMAGAAVGGVLSAMGKAGKKRTKPLRV